MFIVRQLEQTEAKSEICEKVLRDLPDWFGIESSTLDYIEKSKKAPFFAVLHEQNPIGFIYLYAHNTFSIEIYCMGVMKEYHRAGLGKLLLGAAEQYCRENGAAYLTVKTLADTHPDEGYKKTRQFYRAMGYIPLERFDDLWGEGNPCLFLVKKI